MITNAALILILFIPYYMVMFYILVILFIIQAVELSVFIFKRAKQITDFLEIKIFCVNNQSIQI